MTKTANYNLNQWDADDPIRREDFNADNAAIDAALNSLSAAGANAGNCRIATGSYVGDGTFGSNNPITLTMDFKPLWVIVAENGKNTNTGPRALSTCVLVRPLTGGSSTNSTALMVTWGDNSVSWYCNDELEKGNVSQNNYPNYPFSWVAVGVSQ